MVTTNGVRTDRRVVECMTRTLVHRGPDDEGYAVHPEAAFGFRRLSILDLSSQGHQPMASPDGKVVLVFNGEIFNFVELRRDLESRGHSFRSTGDTEVLLAAYREWGSACVSRLNGMWAFLIHDHERRVVFGSRDRFGIKPLYWHRSGDVFLYASEIKAIQASGLYESAPNWEVAADFFLRNNRSAGDQGEPTFFRGIQQVLPGTSFEIDACGRRTVTRYWSLDDFPEAPHANPPAAFADLFEDAVRLRLRSDVPVGVCLSGGLDSTSILCAMHRQWGTTTASRQGRLEAFCYHAPDFDERHYIRDTLAQTGVQPHWLERDPILWDELPRILEAYDQPIYGVTALVGYKLVQLARSVGVKVLLNGQGADEVLGGYRDFFPAAWHGLLRSGRALGAWREIQAYAASHGKPPGKLMRSALRRLARHELGRLWPYRKLASLRRLRAERRNSWYDRRLVEALPRRVEPFREATLRGTSAFAIEQHPLPHLLRTEDRNSMAHSIEARLPFLDYRLVALCFPQTAAWKVRGPWNKFMLREAMRGRIPESVRTRVDKMGFPTQARDWFAGPWYEPMQDLLSGRAVRDHGVIRVENVRRALRLQREGVGDHAEPLLFDVAQLLLWLRRPTLAPVAAASARVGA